MKVFRSSLNRSESRLKDFPADQPKSYIGKTHRWRYRIHVALRFQVDTCRRIAKTAALDNDFIQPVGHLTARKIRNRRVRKFREPVVRPFHNIVRHVAKTERIFPYRTDVVRLVIRIFRCPGVFLRIPAFGCRIDPFRFRRQAIAVPRKIRLQIFQQDRMLRSVQDARTIGINRVQLLRLRERIRIENRVVVRNVHHRLLLESGFHTPAHERRIFRLRHLVFRHVKIIGEFRRQILRFQDDRISPCVNPDKAFKRIRKGVRTRSLVGAGNKNSGHCRQKREGK